MWQSRYLKPIADHWLSRPDLPATVNMAQQIQCVNLLTDTLPLPKQLKFALLGFKSDEGIIRNYGQAGAIKGPNAIRRQLANLPLTRTDITCYDVGDIACFDNDLEAAQSALAHVVSLLLQNQFIPILLGGGHEMAWGHYQGIVKAYPQENIGVINFDAHFDMRTNPQHRATSGTPFLQMAQAEQARQHPFHYYCLGIQPASNIATLFASAQNYKVKYCLAEDFQQTNHKVIEHLLTEAITTHSFLYLSICLDVFASAYAPGVSAPQPLGLTPWQVIPYIRRLAQSARVKSYDLAELCPARDINQITAKLAAQLIFEIIHSQVSPW